MGVKNKPQGLADDHGQINVDNPYIVHTTASLDVDTQSSILADISNSLGGGVDGSVRDTVEKAVNRMTLVDSGGHTLRGRAWEKMLFAGVDTIVV